MSVLCQKEAFSPLHSNHRLGRTEQKWSADALGLDNDWHFGKLRKYSASAADWHPFVEKNLQGAPHQHALSENIRSVVIAEGIRQFPQQHAANKKPRPMRS